MGVMSGYMGSFRGFYHFIGYKGIWGYMGVICVIYGYMGGNSVM